MRLVSEAEHILMWLLVFAPLFVIAMFAIACWRGFSAFLRWINRG
jgi:hypothetical protein